MHINDFCTKLLAPKHCVAVAAVADDDAVVLASFDVAVDDAAAVAGEYANEY